MAGRGASRVPAGRIERLLRLGGAATGVAAGAAVEVARQWWSGSGVSWPAAMLEGLDPHRLADQLARMRGAAMKLGQILSIEAADLLPQPLAAALATLGSAGSTMTDAQLVLVLRRELGPAWERRFREFDFRPIAAASIGQVHRAIAADGRRLAVKVQFPGVAQSIDSDVDNLATIARLSGLLPGGVGLAPLLAEVKRQLRQETDYLAEAEHLRRYRKLVADMPAVVVPDAHEDLTTRHILALDLVAGRPLERLWLDDAPQALRNRVAIALQALVFRELFEFGLMQSDPNFANYLYDHGSGRVVLLDFGSTLVISDQLRDRYRAIVDAAIRDDVDAIADLMLRFGWAPADTPRAQLLAVARVVPLSVEPLRVDGPYDYGLTDLAARARQAAIDLAATHGVRHPPPPELVFVQRKLGGTFAVCHHLRARIDSARMFTRFAAGEPLASLAPASLKEAS
jgi:predicted unusual protein kinase regulating ubiquinone biosynthesis (AarF/ABC1/UbiB family)